jgi:hypothetical protein
MFPNFHFSSARQARFEAAPAAANFFQDCSRIYNAIKRGIGQRRVVNETACAIACNCCIAERSPWPCHCRGAQDLIRFACRAGELPLHLRWAD